MILVENLIDRIDIEHSQEVLFKCCLSPLITSYDG